MSVGKIIIICERESDFPVVICERGSRKVDLNLEAFHPKQRVFDGRKWSDMIGRFPRLLAVATATNKTGAIFLSPRPCFRDLPRSEHRTKIADSRGPSVTNLDRRIRI